MEKKIVLADTSVLIDYFRKTDKSRSQLVDIIQSGFEFCISAITEFEIYSGISGTQKLFWEEFLIKVDVLPFNKQVAQAAAEINFELKQKRNQIDLADLFIAATAIQNQLPMATLNNKHFKRIEGLIFFDNYVSV